MVARIYRRRAMAVNKTSLNTKATDKSIEFITINAESEVQIAHQITEALSECAQHLNATQLKRLAGARASAVAKLNAQKAQKVEVSGNVLQWLGNDVTRRAVKYFGQHRAISSAMVASLIVFTFIVVQQIDFYDNLDNSDAFLLASELPPEAFADKGFDKWLDAKAHY